jgi:GTP-binding protein EngB required for normal cell division
MNAEPHEDLRALLDQAILLLNTRGAEAAHASEQLSALKCRLAEGHFHLAVLGQFKRGKSTLLNALLGREILPTGVVPLTAIPTFIRHGDFLRAQIHYADRRTPETFDWPGEVFAQSLSRYVTESENPGNLRGVAYVDIFQPAPLLRNGMVLIDTPGIGSTLRHNTETTLKFLPQCDAAVFLVSVDPPITEVEIDFLKKVRGQVSRLFFIMNKADYLTPAEMEQAVDFLKGVLRNQVGLGPDTLIHCVSARMGLQAKLAHDSAGWAGSGMEKVETYLTDFLTHGKTLALHEAVSRKATDILEEELMCLRLALRSLQLPMDDLKARLATFEQKISEIQQEMTVASDLLRGEKKRMHIFLESQSEVLRDKARNYLQTIVRELLEGAGRHDRLTEASIRDTLARAVPAFFEHELSETTALFRQKIADALNPHQQRADDLIGAVRQTAAELFDIPYRAPESSQAYDLIREPYWVTRNWTLALTPIVGGFFDRFLPTRFRKSQIQKKLVEQVESLVIRNVENLRWETFQSLNRTFDRFGDELKHRMADTITATQGAIIAAIALRDQKSESAAPEMSRLEAATLELESIRSQFGKLKSEADMNVLAIYEN